MNLCERNILFPLLERLDRNDIRALSSTCADLRRACICILPGYWSSRLLNDPNLDLDRDEIGHASERVHFLHYISKWSPWRVGMSKYDTMAITIMFDNMVLSADRFCVRNARKHPNTLISMAPSLTPPQHCDGNRYKHMTVFRGNAAYLSRDGTLQIKDSGVYASILVPIPPEVQDVKYVNIGHDRRIIVVNHDGTLVTWGRLLGKEPPPLPAPGTKFVMACLGVHCDMALRSDGIIVVWNCTEPLLWQVPALPYGVRYIQICMNNNGIACALRSDGQIVMWGRTGEGENAIPTLPPNTWYVKVKGCALFNMALRSDGCIATWGNCFLDSPIILGPGLGSCYMDMAIESCGSSCAALYSDGHIHTWHHVRDEDADQWKVQYDVYDHF